MLSNNRYTTLVISLLPPYPSPTLSLRTRFQEEKAETVAEGGNSIPTLTPSFSAVSHDKNTLIPPAPSVNGPLDDRGGGTGGVGRSTARGTANRGANGNIATATAAATVTTEMPPPAPGFSHDSESRGEPLPGGHTVSASHPRMSGFGGLVNTNVQQAGASSAAGRSGAKSAAVETVPQPCPSAAMRNGAMFGGDGKSLREAGAPGGSGVGGGVSKQYLVKESRDPISPSGIRAILKGFSLLPWQLNLDRNTKIKNFSRKQHGSTVSDGADSISALSGGDMKEEERAGASEGGGGRDRVRYLGEESVVRRGTKWSPGVSGEVHPGIAWSKPGGGRGIT